MVCASRFDAQICHRACLARARARRERFSAAGVHDVRAALEWFVMPRPSLPVLALLVMLPGCTPPAGTTSTTETGVSGTGDTVSSSEPTSSSASTSATSSSSGDAPQGCAALTATGNDTRWILDPTAGLKTIPSAAQLILTGNPGDHAALLLVPALDAMGQPTLLAAAFDPTTPADAPIALTAVPVPISPPTDQPWGSVVQRAAAAAPGQVVSLIGAGAGSGLGRAHRLTLDSVALTIDLDEDLGSSATPQSLAAADATSESAWIPSGASESNHYFLSLASEKHTSLTDSPSLDCDATPRPMLGALLATPGGFHAALVRCDGSPTSTLAFGPYRDGAFLGQPAALALGFEPAALALAPDGDHLWLVASDGVGDAIRAVPLDAAGAVLGAAVELGAVPYAWWVMQFGDRPLLGLATHEQLTLVRPDGDSLLVAPQLPPTPEAFRSFLAGVGLADGVLVVGEEPNYRLTIDLYPCAP